MQSGASDLADAVKPGDLRFTIHVGQHPAALIVGRRDHRDRFLRDIDPELETSAVNIRKALDDEARRLVPHQNATTIQVAIGVVCAVMWMLDNQNKGICVPDDLPYEHVLNIAKPYLGKLVSEPSDWTPLKNYQIFFKENPTSYMDKKNMWSFNNFLFRH